MTNAEGYEGYNIFKFRLDRGVLFVTIDYPPINLMTLDMVIDDLVGDHLEQQDVCSKPQPLFL